MDKRARRNELLDAIGKAEKLISDTKEQLLLLKGGVIMLNEIITAEEDENHAAT